MSTLLIIIDPWKYTTYGEECDDDLSRSIINFIEDEKFNVVALASYNCLDEVKKSSAVWYKRTDTSLSWYNLGYPEPINQQTQEVLLQYKNSNIRQVSIRHIEELFKYKTIFKIDKIYFAGAAWDMCVQDREVGYLNVIKHFPNVEYFTDTRVIRDQHANIPSMDLYPNWVKISDTLYQYKQ